MASPDVITQIVFGILGILVALFGILIPYRNGRRESTARLRF